MAVTAVSASAAQSSESVSTAFDSAGNRVWVALNTATESFLLSELRVEVFSYLSEFDRLSAVSGIGNKTNLSMNAFTIVRVYTQISIPRIQAVARYTCDHTTDPEMKASFEEGIAELTTLGAQQPINQVEIRHSFERVFCATVVREGNKRMHSCFGYVLAGLVQSEAVDENLQHAVMVCASSQQATGRWGDRIEPHVWEEAEEEVGANEEALSNLKALKARCVLPPSSTPKTVLGWLGSFF
jgi:hypothetical protein